MLRIAFDVGGVLSKYPSTFRMLINALDPLQIEVYVISDMHPEEKIQSMLRLNDIYLEDRFVHSADYVTYGENCKKFLCEQLGIRIMVDDFIGYLADGDFVRLLVMPNPHEPYYSPSWKTDGSEGDFGRRFSAK